MKRKHPDGIDFPLILNKKFIIPKKTVLNNKWHARRQSRPIKSEMPDISSQLAALHANGGFSAQDIVCLGMLAPHEIQGVSMAQVGLLMGFWIFAQLSDAISCRLHAGYRQNSKTKRKNAQTYILELIITPILLFYIIFTVPRIITLEEAGLLSFSPDEGKSCGYCINVIVMLYVFEIIYRDEMNMWLAVHHFVTILWGSAASAMFYETLDLVRLIQFIAGKEVLKLFGELTGSGAIFFDNATVCGHRADLVCGFDHVSLPGAHGHSNYVCNRLYQLVCHQDDSIWTNVGVLLSGAAAHKHPNR